MEYAFWLNQVAKVLALYGLAYVTGVWVNKHGVKVNYTRKINHFVLFFLPHVLMRLNPFTPTVATTIAGATIGVLTLVLMTLAEAFSPHSWDSPFLFLVGGMSLAGVLQYC